MTDFYHELADSLLEYWYEETAASLEGMAKILRESCVSSETYKKALRDATQATGDSAEKQAMKERPISDGTNFAESLLDELDACVYPAWGMELEWDRERALEIIRKRVLLKRDNERCRRIAQALIEEIGSVGPENAEQTVERALVHLRRRRGVQS